MNNPVFTLSHDSFGRLVLVDSDGDVFEGVEPVRAFPFSDPRRWVSLCDQSGREIVCVEELDDLPEPLRRTIESELSRREFLPRILTIVRVRGQNPPCEWQVATDRGDTRFTIETDDAVRRLGRDRILITDSVGLRYIIPNVAELDAASKRKLDRYL